jgi:hypothetical protein
VPAKAVAEQVAGLGLGEQVESDRVGCLSGKVSVRCEVGESLGGEDPLPDVERCVLGELAEQSGYPATLDRRVLKQVP